MFLYSTVSTLKPARRGRRGSAARERAGRLRACGWPRKRGVARGISAPAGRTDGGDRGHNLAQLELIKDGGLAGRVQPHLRAGSASTASVLRPRAWLRSVCAPARARRERRSAAAARASDACRPAAARCGAARDTPPRRAQAAPGNVSRTHCRETDGSASTRVGAQRARQPAACATPAAAGRCRPAARRTMRMRISFLLNSFANSLVNVSPMAAGLTTRPGRQRGVPRCTGAKWPKMGFASDGTICFVPITVRLASGRCRHLSPGRAP